MWTESRRGPRSATHTAQPLSPEDRLLFGARFKPAALCQRNNPTSVTYAAQLSQAIASGDYGGMSSILKEEQDAATESALAGLQPYRPSGGRPQAIELSVERLDDTLDEFWTAICGYRNRMGETDVTAVGPFGICAMEVKNYQGVINIEGADWISTRYDRYGNPSATDPPAPIQDAGGRSPSEQVNQIAGALETVIAGRFDFPITIRHVVILTHERRELGGVRNPNLDSILKMAQVSPASIFGVRDHGLSDDQIRPLVGTIQSDSH